MKRKILAILISMLFIATIPSAIGDIIEPDSEDEWIFMRGLLSHRLRRGNVNNCIVIHLVVWYNTSSGLKREVYWFEQAKDIDFLRDLPYLGRMYEVGLGLFIYIFTFNSGGLKIL